MPLGYDRRRLNVYTGQIGEMLAKIHLTQQGFEVMEGMDYEDPTAVSGGVSDLELTLTLDEEGTISQGMVRVRGGDYDLRDVFLFLEEGRDKQGRVKGSFQARPVSTRLRQRMETLGINLPPELVAVAEGEEG